MAASFLLPSLQLRPPLRINPLFAHAAIRRSISSHSAKISAKFDLLELLGGRGLCKGERGVQEELKKTIIHGPSSGATSAPGEETSGKSSPSLSSLGGEDAFEKELLGLTGGFPGGEKGLKKFIEENPPPKKANPVTSDAGALGFSNSKPKPPELPLFMPGMIVIVKNPKSPYYMYCGIIQRVTDGVAGVLFEGGNWDKLLTFPLSELERRDKGPPMVNPKSAVLEPLLEKKAAENS